MKKKDLSEFQQFYQGDVSILRLPDSYKLPELEAEIPPENMRVRLLEGELTGHHHEIDLLERPDTEATIRESFTNAFSGESAPGDSALDVKKFFENTKKPTARFYKASNLAAQLVREGIMLRTDLTIGLLKVEGGPMRVKHPEHGSIMLAPGNYVIGRQIESVSNEERAVSD